MFIRHLITQFLIANILFSNLVWAIDECGYLFDVPTPEINASLDVQFTDRINLESKLLKKELIKKEVDNDKNTGINNCDVSCSANAHLLYISFSFPAIDFTDVHSIIFSSDPSYRSFNRQPPTKPPRV